MTGIAVLLLGGADFVLLRPFFARVSHSEPLAGVAGEGFSAMLATGAFFFFA